MATSQDLVPTNQPYGQRQETVAARQQAGVPLSSQGAVSPFEGLDVAAQPLRRARPDYDALLETEPPPPPLAPPALVPQQGVVSPREITDRFLERARLSENSFDRAVATRLAALRGE